LARSIQSGEKEHADLSGRSGCGHLLLVCAECPLKSKLCRCPAAQMGVAKSDFSRMCRSRSEFDYERGAFRLDWSRSIRIWLRTQPLCAR